MGVHDHRCSVCGPPTMYVCGEKAGEEDGMGDDPAVLDLFFFAAGDAPKNVHDFEQARGRARRTETQPYGHTWGDWEVVPRLNYWELLMGAGDGTGIWRIEPSVEGSSDGGPVSLEMGPDEQVWVANGGFRT